MNRRLFRRSPLFRRWKTRSRSGVAAIEFALVAPILFVLIMAVLETGLIYFAQFVMKDAVAKATRLIRTNQADSLTSAAAFRTYVCDTAGANLMLSSCDSKLGVYAVSFSSEISSFTATSFSNAVAASAVDADGNMTSAYDSGVVDACNVVFLRVSYGWGIVTPGLTWFLVNLSGNRHLLSVTEVFRNEPSATTSCTN